MHPLEEFMEREDECLQQILKSELGKDITEICSSCSKPGAVIRCNECFGSHTHCQDCTLQAHKTAPLHKLEVSKCYRFIIEDYLSQNFLVSKRILLEARIFGGTGTSCTARALWRAVSGTTAA